MVISFHLFIPCSSFQWSRFELIDYANITVKINQNIYDLGADLMLDQFGNKKFFGMTVNRQMFDRQFISDISRALNVSKSRVIVSSIVKGSVHFSWGINSSIVSFLLLERNKTSINSELSLPAAIVLLTRMAQDTRSQLYFNTSVASKLDPTWGVVVSSWDASLRLFMAIEVVGGMAVQNGNLIDAGGRLICDNKTESSSLTYNRYCEFERFFENDLSFATNITSSRIQILFITRAAPDAVLVQFRVFPSIDSSVPQIMTTLSEQAQNLTSLLYRGNVTIRVDPAW